MKLPTITQNTAHMSQRKIRAMLRANIRDSITPRVGKQEYIWRDTLGWVGQAPVIRVDPYGLEVNHKVTLKSSILNRVRSLEDGIPASIEHAAISDTSSSKRSTTYIARTLWALEHDSDDEDTHNPNGTN